MTIDEQNRLLTTEYQRLGPLAWIRSDDKRLSFPFVLEDDNDNVVYDYYANPATGLIETRPVIDYFPLLPRFQGGETEDPIWVLCHMEYMDEHTWKSVYGTVWNYTPAQWLPTYTSSHDVIPLHLTETPTETKTWGMIHFLRSLHMPRPGEYSYEKRRRDELARRRRRDENKYALRHTMGAFGKHLNESGKRNMGVSFPTSTTSTPVSTGDSNG